TVKKRDMVTSTSWNPHHAVNDVVASLHGNDVVALIRYPIKGLLDKSRHSRLAVIPAKAGIQGVRSCNSTPDSRFRGNDDASYSHDSYSDDSYSDDFL